MDLYAYSQIPRFTDLAKKNGIDVPRLRGYRLMSEEELMEDTKGEEQYEVFNRYVGRPDVLMIHARIGGNNWEYYDGDNTVAKEPWFLEKVDDCDDNTYCDIYARVKVEDE